MPSNSTTASDGGLPGISGVLNAKAEGPTVNVFIEVPDGAGGTKRVALEKILWDPKSKKPAPKMTFVFTGSVIEDAGTFHIFYTGENGRHARNRGRSGGSPA